MSSQPSSRTELGSRLALFVRLVLSLALALLSLPLLSSASTAVVCAYPVEAGDVAFGDYPKVPPVPSPNDNTTFEIDGNKVVCQYEDWNAVGTQITDGLDDATNFQGSSKEFEHPSGWVIGPSLTPADKADIDNVWIYNPDAGAGQHTYSYFGFSRGFTNGTTSYDVEYNQSPNTVGNLPRPNRSPGDLLVQLDQQGSPGYKFEISGAFIWRLGSDPLWSETDCRDTDESDYTPPASWCLLPNPGASFQGAVSMGDAPFVDGAFAEGGLDITNLFGRATCVGDFRVMNIRSRSSNSPDSALKDWVSPQPVDIDGNCQDLVIEKRDAVSGVNIAGATFSITPDPRPGADNDPPATIIVTDNVDAADLAADPIPGQYPANQVADEDTRDGFLKITQIEPGTYTVTETQAPIGYFMAPDPEGACPLVNAGDLIAVNCARQTISTATGRWVFKDKKIWLAPSITKTADGSYDSSYSWTIRKTVAPDGQNPAADDPNTEDADESGLASQNVAEGQSATFDYEVTVTGTEATSGYQVQGNVTVVNPNDESMTVTLSDKIKNGAGYIGCTFDADDGGDYVVSVPATDMTAQPVVGTSYPYTCALTEAQATSPNLEKNYAWIEWDLDAYPQLDTPDPWGEHAEPGTQNPPASATVDFDPPPATATNKTVTVSDLYADPTEFGGPKTVTFGEDPSKLNTAGDTYTVSWKYDKVFSGDPVGRCTPHENIATLDQTVGADKTDNAIATVCVGGNLTVKKNVVTSLKRSYAYAIDKSVADSTLDVNPTTGKATANYSVVVTDGAATDSDWLMSGQITVTNPNNVAVTLATITDKYGTTSCSVQSGDKVIPAENYSLPGDQGTRTFDYTCSFGNAKPPYDAANVAEVTWSKNSYATPSDKASYSVQMTPALWEDVATDPDVDSTFTKVNPKVTVYDNKTVPGQSIKLGEVTWTSSGFTHPAFTYSLELAGSPGRCIRYDNTARIDETGQSDSASVTVCYPVNPTVDYPVNPTVDKTVVGTYDRTYLWEITKEADQTSVETDGENGAEVNYTVTATPDGYTDGGWTMNGTITVSNPNDFKSMTVDITDVPNVGPGVTCVVTSGTGVVVPPGTLVNGAVVPGTASRSYVCSVPQQPLYQGGTNTAVITWAGGAASSPAKPVVFALAGETDKTIHVIDDKTVTGDEIALGTATWNDLGSATEFTYSLDLGAAANACETYTNTAEIVETGQFADATVEACGPEVLPAEEVRPPVVKGVEAVLPSTGGPQLGLAWAGLGMLLAGGVLMAARRKNGLES